MEGEIGDPQMGLQARLMSQALYKRHQSDHLEDQNLHHLHQSDPPENRRVMFGNPETTAGGPRGTKFYASVRLDVR